MKKIKRIEGISISLEDDFNSNENNNNNDEMKVEDLTTTSTTKKQLLAIPLVVNNQLTTRNAFCDVCSIDFPDLFSYENHYKYIHLGVCSTCSRRFPALRLLEMHISEQHDPAFQFHSLKSNSVISFVHYFLLFFVRSFFLSFISTT